MTVVDATTGESTGDNGRGVYGEVTGDRTGRAETEGAEAAFTAYVQERRASLYATAYHL
ncbi:SigE family RNA polymerase sigma factor, partial [Streptomyces sp. SID8455]|nr:SigE family RNA polymerase sigma factor [Streptomyces sp. SID8455]